MQVCTRFKRPGKLIAVIGNAGRAGACAALCITHCQVADQPVARLCSATVRCTGLVAQFKTHPSQHLHNAAGQLRGHCASVRSAACQAVDGAAQQAQPAAPKPLALQSTTALSAPCASLKPAAANRRGAWHSPLHVLGVQKRLCAASQASEVLCGANHSRSLTKQASSPNSLSPLHACKCRIAAVSIDLSGRHGCCGPRLAPGLKPTIDISELNLE